MPSLRLVHAREFVREFRVQLLVHEPAGQEREKGQEQEQEQEQEREQQREPWLEQQLQQRRNLTLQVLQRLQWKGQKQLGQRSHSPQIQLQKEQKLFVHLGGERWLQLLHEQLDRQQTLLWILRLQLQKLEVQVQEQEQVQEQVQEQEQGHEHELRLRTMS